MQVFILSPKLGNDRRVVSSRRPCGAAGLMFATIYEIDTSDGYHPPVCRG